MADKIMYISFEQVWIHILKFMKFLRVNILVLVAAGMIGGVLGVAITFYKKPIYYAHLSFLLNDNETPQLNLSALSGLAAISGLGGGSNINEDKLLFLAKSRFLMVNTLLSSVQLNGKNTVLAEGFIDLFNLQRKFEKDTLLTSFSRFKHTHVDSLTIQESKIVDMIIWEIEERQMLSIEGRKKAGIVAQSMGVVTVDFNSTDEPLARLFVDKLYANLSVYYVNKIVQRQQRNYNIIKGRADSLKLVMSNKETYGAEFIDNNLNVSKMVGRVKIERTRRDIEVLNLMYGEVLKNLEIAKFNLENQTPMLQLIDSPSYPLKQKRLSAFKFGLAGAFLAGILALLFLTFRKQLAATAV